MKESDLQGAFRGKRALVAGGLGFIGSTLARRLAGLGAEVLAADALLPDQGGNRFNLAGAEGKNLAVEILDLRQGHLDRLVQGRDFLFNLAGQQSHLGSMDAPLDDLDLNCRVALALLEACRKSAPGMTVVYTSTRQVYGKPRSLPVDESHPLAPVDINGIHKLAGEQYHLLYHRLYGLKSAVLRLTNTYGPRMRVKDARQTFIGLWLRDLIEGKPFEVWEGAGLRDFTYVDDAVEALLLAACQPKAQGQAFNLGGGAALSLKDLAGKLVAGFGGGGYALKQFPPERKRIDIGDYQADDRRFRAASGWEPRVPLEEGLKRSLDYYRVNLAHYL
ncbi:MAG: NAD-dependent epimerase/dehydratase family protein [Stellaceae bacterium]|jgi:UDP-glucose 4-epimerase